MTDPILNAAAVGGHTHDMTVEAASKEDAPPATPSSPAEIAGKALSVLLIDDDPEMQLLGRYFLKGGLEWPTFLCETAPDLASGLKAIAAKKFDAVVLDLGLPDSSGVETVSRLRSQAPDIPVVVLTGSAEERIGVEALKRGAQDLLVKEAFEPRSLKRAIVYAVYRKCARQDPPAPARAGGRDGGAALLSAAESGDMEAVKKLLGDGVRPDEGRTDEGYTALMLAVIGGHRQIVGRLLDAGANSLLETKRGINALDLAAEDRWREELASGAATSRDGEPASPLAGKPPRAGAGLIRGRYKLLREIGRGSVGVVFEGKDTKLARIVTIKKIRDDIKARPAERERLLAAARKAEALEHSCVARLQEVVDEGDACLVFEHVEGTTLKDLLARRGEIPFKESLLFMTGVIRALAYAHGLGVAHGSLSPSNIMVCKQGYAKVTDFMTAREAKDILAKLGVQDASIEWAYAAPEVAIKGERGPRSDLYSLGACFYEMLAGVRAFPGPDFRAQKERMDFKPLEKLLPGVLAAKAIERCLSFDPAARFPGVPEFAKALGL